MNGVLVAVAIAVFAIFGIYAQGLKMDRDKWLNEYNTVESARKEAVERVGELVEVADALKEEMKKQATLAADLALKNESLYKTAAERQRAIKELIRENAKIKEWTDTALPDDVKRLLNKPAVTGSEGYQNRLSGGQPMLPAGGQP